MKFGNPTFLTGAIGLTILGLGGCLAIYSARSFGEDPFYFALRQLVWLGSGVIVFLALARIPFRFYVRYAAALAVLAFTSLILVLIFGTTINGMRGWFSLGGGVLLQPSELAKGAYLLLLSTIAAEETKSERSRFLRMAGAGAAFCGILLLQPDFGTASVYFLALATVVFVSTFRRRYLFFLAAGALPCAAVFLLKYDYAAARIAGYLNPDAHLYGAGWHIKQFQYTLAHGGLFGSEWEGALWSNAYLPLAHSDSAFAAIVESGGGAGGLLIPGGFLAMVWLFRETALRTGDPAARILIFSSGALCAIQALLHIGVNTALLPPTGLTLPIFSYGGSSLLGTMILFALACSASGCGEAAPPQA